MRNFRITVDGTAYDVSVEEVGGEQDAPLATPSPSAARTAAAASAPREPVAAAPAPASAATPSAGPGDIASPLAANVVKISVTVGQQVSAGQELLVLEAMKMNNFITAPQDGKVTAVHVSEGAAVSEGQPLLSLG